MKENDVRLLINSGAHADQITFVGDGFYWSDTVIP